MSKATQHPHARTHANRHSCTWLRYGWVKLHVQERQRSDHDRYTKGKRAVCGQVPRLGDAYECPWNALHEGRG